MSALIETKISVRKNQSVNVFEQLLGDFRQVDYTSPHNYVEQYWNAYKQLQIDNKSLNGNIFELIIYTLLYREGILPFYEQAKVAFVPGVEFDTILYSKEKPISLSLKTSLRERFKQADLEAIALKYVHRKSECYLLTLDMDEANSVNNKINEGTAIGLNRAYWCFGSDFDDFIRNYLKEVDLTEAGKIEIINGRLIPKS